MLLWLTKIIRLLFILLDKVAYWAVYMIYELFMMLSETGVFTQATIQKFAGRIYALLGVFMLFKVSFSLITYILNPDDLTDKGKGVNKLLTNFFVVLIGLIAVPYVFQAAFSLQTIVLKDNIVGNIILGNVAGDSVEEQEENASDYIEKGGHRMAFTTLTAFLRLNSDVVGEECSNEPIVNGEVNSACEDSSALQIESDSGTGTVEATLKQAYADSDVNILLDGGLVNLRADDQNGNETWLFDYTYLISTIAGGFLAWILLIFCFDVAKRSVKLGFLQLIAPVPIISYIDPKSGKDGMFKKWVKECTSTYISLFGRLVAIYFAIFVISEMSLYNIMRPDEKVTNIFVRVFIIFGALMFAKQLPELISNITGFKLDGGFTLNPMKKIGQSPFAAGLVGAAGGFAGGMYANARAAKKDGLGFWKGAGSVLAGGMSAGFRGGAAGLSSGGKGSALAAASKGVQGSNAARYRRDVNQAAGYGLKQRASDSLDRFANVKNKSGGLGLYDQQMKGIKREMDNLQSQEQALRNAQALHMADNPNVDFSDEGRRKVRADFTNLKNKSAGWAEFEKEMSKWTDQERLERQTSIDEYNKFKTDYEAKMPELEKDMEAVTRYESFSERINANDSKYEELRKEYGRYEDVSKARDVNNKK